MLEMSKADRHFAEMSEGIHMSFVKSNENFLAWIILEIKLSYGITLFWTKACFWTVCIRSPILQS